MSYSDALEYGNPDYWDSWYERVRGQFEWYMEFDDYAYALEDYLTGDRASQEVLVLGCGSSKMGEQLYNRGFHHITNIDTCAKVIDDMAAKYSHLDGVDFHVGDASRLLFPCECFDVVMDKGCLDALLCAEGGKVDAVYMVVEGKWKILRAFSQPSYR
eukprot:GHVR01114714.1.p1 GENE.GHVR01114714.1~~GHVR01114714.1.p1  ORF type:complete len:170 (+),score=33.66 GHVR01114714.1:37-510(+)